MATLIASPAQMALKLRDLEEKIEELDQKITKMQGKAQITKDKDGRRNKKNN